MPKIVFRRDIVSGKIFPKDELMRVVRLTNGQIGIEKDIHLFGRGSYLKKDLKTIEMAQKKNLLSKSLRCNVSSEIYEKLKQLI